MIPLLTLTTDFGTQDGYVGAMKGRLLRLIPEVALYDLTHEIAPQNLLQAALTLRRSIPHFPPGALHLAVIDPGVGSERAGLLIETETFTLIGPDNGIFSLLLAEFPPLRLLRLHRHTPYWQAHTSFDGLAVFAPAAAAWVQGVPWQELGEVIESYHSLSLPQPQRTPQAIQGEILLFDRFGNALTNLKPADWQIWGQGIEIQVKKQARLPLQTHYQAHGAKSGQAVALVNSDGLLEVALVCGSLREAWRLKPGDSVWVFPKKNAV